MRKEHLNLLVCPKTGLPLQLIDEKYESGRIKEGFLLEPGSNNRYPVVNFIPRFVPLENYAASFGFQWNVHNKTQFDQFSKHNLSKDRFEKEADWGTNLGGQLLLEVGGGSGRFTEHAVATGATVVSVDYSNAVDANYRSNGKADNLLIVQASVYEMPLRKVFFDKIFCFGVLQHTPDPQKSFGCMVHHLKAGGQIATDIYLKDLFRYYLQTKYYVRPLTRKMKAEKLYTLITRYIHFIWPLARLIRKIPKIGPVINWRLLVADYSRELDHADENTLKEWAILDTFDMLSPAYDFPQTLRTFKKWHMNFGLQDIDIFYGYNGIVGRGVKKK